ncbi:hypothetical protein WN944_029089 [Citrus x changshan-huyou]|uniref:Uncharacterized protein n=1 Tax=Citrus x changshan-huyou TaxID=2935761 RepID=A0AAP0LNZ4_9ROSI
MKNGWGKKDLAAVEYDDDDENATAEGCEDERPDRDTQEQLSSDSDSDKECRKYDEQLEEFLDQAYENYVAIKGGSTKTCEKCLCPRGPTLKGCVIKSQFPLGLMWPLFFSLCHDSCCLHIVIFLLLLCKA